MAYIKIHFGIKSGLWPNPGEIPGNGIDDDHNGYVDDYYGWNFPGNKEGQNVVKDSYESARVYSQLKSLYRNSTPNTAHLKGEAKKEAANFLRAKAQVKDSIDLANMPLIKQTLTILESGGSIISKDLGKKEFALRDLRNYSSPNSEAMATASLYIDIIQINPDSDHNTNKSILKYLREQIQKEEKADTPPEDYRGEIVRDNYNDINDRYYGNPNVMAGKHKYGTALCGIIGGGWNDVMQIGGIADSVKMMMVRAVPDEGIQHDKDIALAIRYAVDNGTRTINMSLSERFSSHKHWVDDAIRYADDHDVLYHLEL